jgi:hypothetical protein
MKIDIRLISINIVLTILFILTLNLLSNFVLFIGEQVNYVVNREHQVGLPAFLQERDSTKIVYQEFSQIPTEYKPFIGWSRKPFQGLTTNIDSNGDRIHKNQVSEENFDKSVYFFGGSTMWGSGVSDRETIPAFFNNISGIPTLNKGERAFTSRQSLAKLINLIAGNEKIETVVFYDGANDIAVHCRRELDVNEHMLTEKIRNLLEENSSDPSKKFINYLDIVFLRGTRHLVTALSSQANQLASQDFTDKLLICDDRGDRAIKVANTLVNNWEIARDIAVARGIKFFAILQPVAFIGKPKLDHLEYVDVYENYGIEEQYKTLYPLIQKLIQKREHDWIFDYTDLFSVDEPIYMDFVHVFANGNQKIAERLYQDIKPYL